MEKQALLNTYINNVTMPETIAAIEQMIEADKKSYVVAEDAYVENPSDDFVFASLVAEFAMILSDSDNKGTSNFATILDTYKTLDVDDEYKDEFYYLVKQLAKH